MRSAALIAVLGSLLGAVTTVAVAWGCALLVDLQRPRERAAEVAFKEADPSFAGTVGVRVFWSAGAAFHHSSVNGADYRRVIPLGFGESPVETPPSETDVGVLLRTVAPSARRAVFPWLFGDQPWPQNDASVLRTVDARGWPCLCMWNEYMFSPGSKYVFTPRGGITLDGWLKPRRIVIYELPVTLPCLPLWRGIVLNMLCFGSAWWLVLFAPKVLRTHLRRRRGRCHRCSYDLRATPPDAPCPECGHTDLRTQ